MTEANGLRDEIILYSFAGRFDIAKKVVDNHRLLLYAPVFIFSIWDSYRLALQLNHFSVLADWGGRSVQSVSASFFMEINVLDKRSPWVSVAWTILIHGLGHIYTHRIPTGSFLLVWWIAIAYFSFLLPSIQFTTMGESTAIYRSCQPHPSFKTFVLFALIFTFMLTLMSNFLSKNLLFFYCPLYYIRIVVSF